jgi:hypothetical protein
LGRLKRDRLRRFPLWTGEQLSDGWFAPQSPAPRGVWRAAADSKPEAIANSIPDDAVIGLANSRGTMIVRSHSRMPGRSRRKRPQRRSPMVEKMLPDS